MRIAVVSTINLTTPPVGYGGIERLVHVFVEELIRSGNEVTLIARRGSRCSGRTIEVDGGPESSGGKVLVDEEPLHRAVEEYVAAERPDVVHDWSLTNQFVNRKPDAVPFVVSTCVPQAPGYAQRNVVAASAAHAKTLKGGKVPFIRFGIDVERLEYSKVGGQRLVHLAKIARYKAQHLSMIAATLARVPLDVVGNIEGRRYARYIVQPMAALLPGVRLFGESLDGNGTLRSALGLVLTPQWFETFPLVSLQSLASGTPVITLASGGLPEQIEQGVNGFVANGVSELASYMGRVHELSRQACRDTAMERFHVRRMAQEYMQVYQRVRDGDTW